MKKKKQNKKATAARPRHPTGQVRARARTKETSISRPLMSGPRFRFGRAAAYSQGHKLGDLRIKRVEPLGPFAGTTSFLSVVDQTINPGVSTIFPWLSNLARNFEQYQFNELRFHFLSTSADAVGSTNTALGQIVMAINYDVVDAPFGSIAAFQDYEGSVTTKPSRSAVLHAECNRKRTSVEPMYVMAEGSQPSGTDARLYHFGRFQLATQGMQAASVVGDLFVEYDVTLIRPKLFVSPDVATYHAYGEVKTDSSPISGSPPFTDGKVHYLMHMPETKDLTVVQNSFPFNVRIDQSGTRVAFLRKKGASLPPEMDVFMWIRVSPSYVAEGAHVYENRSTPIGPWFSYFNAHVEPEQMDLNSVGSSRSWASVHIESSGAGPHDAGETKIVDGDAPVCCANAYTTALKLRFPPQDEFDPESTDPSFQLNDPQDFGIENWIPGDLESEEIKYRFEIVISRLSIPIPRAALHADIDPRRVKAREEEEEKAMRRPPSPARSLRARSIK